jgi:hypothetical protein
VEPRERDPRYRSNKILCSYWQRQLQPLHTTAALLIASLSSVSVLLIWTVSVKIEASRESLLLFSHRVLNYDGRPEREILALLTKAPCNLCPGVLPSSQYRNGIFFVRQLDGRDQSLKNAAVGFTSILISFTPGIFSVKARRSLANCSATVGPACVPTYTTPSIALTLTLGQESTK